MRVRDGILRILCDGIVTIGDRFFELSFRQPALATGDTYETQFRIAPERFGKIVDSEVEFLPFLMHQSSMRVRHRRRRLSNNVGEMLDRLIEPNDLIGRCPADRSFALDLQPNSISIDFSNVVYDPSRSGIDNLVPVYQGCCCDQYDPIARPKRGRRTCLTTRASGRSQHDGESGREGDQFRNEIHGHFIPQEDSDRILRGVTG